ncbi:MAG: hypothetical protein OXQ28_04820, partial [Acidobacteriota bacterium]|nr:hypothetical protein [Acidobacteriota bacterium]
MHLVVRHPAVPVLGMILGLLIGTGAAPAQEGAAGQPEAERQEAERQEAEPDRETPQPGDDPLSFLDAVTVTATLRPAPVQDIPGMVSVIDDETIQERLVQDFADLVKYEPGVYVENNVTRLGLN